MGEPTGVELVGGLADGWVCAVEGDGVVIPTQPRGRDPETGQPMYGKVTYRDTGRRTADGRRVFAPEA